MAIEYLQTVFRGNRITQPTVNLIAMFIEQACIIEEVTVQVKSSPFPIGGTAKFNVAKNGTYLFDSEDEIELTSSTVSKTGLSESAGVGDVITLDVKSVPQSGIYTPVALKLKLRTETGTQEEILLETGSIENGASEQGSFSLAKAFLLKKIVASGYCRIRLYKTAAQRNADVSRVFGDRSYRGTEHGIITDVKLTASTGVNWIMSPDALGSNGDTPNSETIYYTIENNTGGSSELDITFSILRQEV